MSVGGPANMSRTCVTRFITEQNPRLRLPLGGETSLFRSIESPSAFWNLAISLRPEAEEEE